MDKESEIKLLQTYIGAAKDAGADYLAEALESLSVPFETAIRSDFPGSMAVYSMAENLRGLSKDVRAHEKRLADLQSAIRVAHDEREITVARLSHVKREVDETREKLKKLAYSM